MTDRACALSSGLFDLSGQTALVTGAGQGLGLAIATALADQGAHVLLTDRDEAALQRAGAGLSARGAGTLTVVADVSQSTDVRRLTEAALAWRGGPDILVCNAGVAGPAGPLSQATELDWQHVFDINLRGAAQLANGLIPAMAAKGLGSVVFMSSIAGLRGNGALGLYGLSKAALAQLARNLAVEWGPHGVRVNAVSPGLIRTPLSGAMMDNSAFMSRRLAVTPMRRVGEPHEVAGVVVMLASKAGGFVTGQNIVVDGGTLISDGS